MGKIQVGPTPSSQLPTSFELGETSCSSAMSPNAVERPIVEGIVRLRVRMRLGDEERDHGPRDEVPVRADRDGQHGLEQQVRAPAVRFARTGIDPEVVLLER